MSENTNLNKKDEKEQDKNKAEVELNYSFSALDNNIDLNNQKKEEIKNRKSLKKGKILGGQFILGEKIGKGTFGVVRLATHIITNEKVAVKMLYKEKILKEESAIKRIEKEIKILKILRHRNIVQLYNVFQDSSTIFLVMEHIQGKELFEQIIKKRKLSEIESLLYFQQLISGIEYLGKLGIAHRDLKPENLMIDTRKVLKITDFGLSSNFKKNELLSTPCGSPSYAAPEMLSGEKYWGPGADIWSCGVILYTMLCGRLPFEDKDNSKLYEKIKKGIFSIPEFLSENAKDFLVKILNVDPKKRYNITQIKKHPWFNQLDQKKFMSRGLLLYKYIVPIDEEIVEKMKKEYEYNEKEIRMNILANKHNHITTTYYLFLKLKIKNGNHSIADMVHSEFINYIHNPKNFIDNYKGDWNKLFKERAIKINNAEKVSLFSKKNSKKIEINDDKINLTSNFNSITLKKEDNNNINNNEFKEKIEELNKKRISKINDNNNDNNKIGIEDKKDENKNKNELNEIKVNPDLNDLENKEKIVTINLEEITSHKNDNTNINKKESIPLNTIKVKNIINKNKTIKVNSYTHKKLNSANIHHNLEVKKYKPKSELAKKAQILIAKYKANYQKKLNEENKRKIKRKTISIKIKKINIETKTENRYFSKNKKNKSITNINKKNYNKTIQTNSTLNKVNKNFNKSVQNQ